MLIVSGLEFPETENLLVLRVEKENVHQAKVDIVLFVFV